MRCEEVLNQLNARADGELPAEDAAELDAHLAECSQCRAAAEGLADNRCGFAPRVCSATRGGSAAGGEHCGVGSRFGSAAATSRAAPAACACARGWHGARYSWVWRQDFCWRSWCFGRGSPSPTCPIDASAPLPPAEPVARLAVASGPVEVQLARELSGFHLSARPRRSSAIRSFAPDRPARCEISLKDGNALRLDCNTEVTLHESEVVEVSRGRLWSSSQPGRKGLEIQSGGGTIVAKPAAQLAVDCQPRSGAADRGRRAR